MIIDDEVKNLKHKIRIHKSFFSKHPESGYNEIETSEYIIKELQNKGFVIKSNVAKTGIVATFNGNCDKPCILFRCEMDALKMDQNGRMKHACGHDAHMTILLALADLISMNKEKIQGNIKLLFQPAEETYGGAQKMIAEGALNKPEVDAVFALHIWSELTKQTIGIKSGSVMSATDPFDIKIKGKGGHAAIPEKCIDPIYIASLINIEINSIAKKYENENDNIVISITAIKGGTSNNIIPETVEMKGIFRTYNNNIRGLIRNRIIEISESIAKSMNAKATVSFKEGNYPAVVNDEKICGLLENIAGKIVGKEKVVKDYKTMCSDDFSYFLEKRRGAYIFVGNGQKVYYPQHSEGFNVDTDTMLLGTQIFYDIIKNYSYKKDKNAL
ncbi:MAG TPA: M20 family metallopeptidase [Clostridia bacterium]|nr:M20 family metallopeptidase [Clostridia bacterium]